MEQQLARSGLSHGTAGGQPPGQAICRGSGELRSWLRRCSMKGRTGGVAVAAAILSAVLSVHPLAQDASVPLKRLAQQIEFAGRAGAPQTAVLFGDPTKAGFSVTRVR